MYYGFPCTSSSICHRFRLSGLLCKFQTVMSFILRIVEELTATPDNFFKFIPSAVLVLNSMTLCACNALSRTSQFYNNSSIIVLIQVATSTAVNTIHQTKK